MTTVRTGLHLFVLREKRISYKPTMVLDSLPIELVFAVIPLFSEDVTNVLTAFYLHVKYSFLTMQLEIAEKVRVKVSKSAVVDYVKGEQA